VAEAQPEAPVTAAQPATSAAEARLAPAAAEAQLETAVAVAQQEPAATAVQPEAAAMEQQGPALAGSSQATAMEIPDDDVPPPGWDQWASLPTPAPEPQAGAIVRRWDGHMVAGSLRHGAEASSSRVGPPASSDPAVSLGQEQERVDAPPPRPLRRRPRGAAAVGGDPRPRRLAQPGAEQGAADPRRPAVACLSGVSTFVSLLLSSLLCCFRVCLCDATLIGLCLLVARARAPCP
jgi:hypothetical protein